MKTQSLFPWIRAGVLLSVSAAVQANPPAGQTPGPSADTRPKPGAVIQFASTAFEFGKIKSGEVVKHDFIFTNTGVATLEILDVKPGCGCTTAGAWDRKVEPGRTGCIAIQFNSAGYGGPIGKAVIVTCNDTLRSNLVLQINGTAWRPIDINPLYTVFTLSSEAPSNETKVVHLVSNLEEPMSLSDLRCTNSAFKVELKEVKPGKQFEVRITVLTPLTTTATFSAISLQTSSTNAPTLNLFAYASMQPPVSASPPQLVLPAPPLTSPKVYAVQVRNNGTNALQLSDVRLDAPGVDLKLTQVQTGQLYSVLMTFPAGFEIQAGKTLELTMKSSHPSVPELRVPVLQMRPAVAAAAPAAPPLK